MARVILVGLGSSGDVHPLLGIAEGMQRRGHDCVLVSAPTFEESAESVGVAFSPVGTAEAYDAVYAHPDLWHPRRGLKVFFSYAAGLTGETVEAVESRLRPGETVVVSTFQCFGARVARELHDVPLCTVLPNPILLQSVHDPNRNPVGNPPRWLGPWAVGLMYRVINGELSRHARHGINAARKARGLGPPVRDVVGWSRSPDLVVGLWPSLVSAPQPDWPPQARTTGFVAYDGPTARGWSMPEEVAERDDWVVFTPGTQMTHGAAYFAAAAEAAERLRTPTLFVTRSGAALPDRLPDTVRHLSYAPFSSLFRHAALVVHHGGIGTAGRALQAGVPQLIVPSGFDQFDNAARVVRGGWGRELDRKHLDGPRLASAIQEILDDPRTRGHCDHMRDRLAAVDAVDETCSAIEGLLAA